MDELWRIAGRRASEFDAGAVAYDRFRPRYPAGVFDDIVERGGLGVGATAVEIGAGTGIATGPLVERGLEVVAIEPAPGMAALGQAALGDRVTWINGRFEDWNPDAPVDLVAAFNSWHWVEPSVGVEQVATVLRPGGVVALVWTDVVSWGGEAFEAGLLEAFGAPWPKSIDASVGTRHRIAEDTRFEPFHETRHRFERTMDAATFVAVTRTYGGVHTQERDELLTGLIEGVGGSVTKVEDAVLYLTRRR